MSINIPIGVDFDAIPEYELLEAGVFDAIVEQLTYNEPASEEKLSSIQVLYTLTEDGDLNGRQISQWVSVPDPDKQQRNKLYGTAMRYRDFFAAFDVDPGEGLQVDEESGVVTSPDLSGTTVQIKVSVEPHYLDRTKKVNKINEPPVVTTPKAKAANKPGRVVRTGGRSIE